MKKFLAIFLMTIAGIGTVPALADDVGSTKNWGNVQVTLKNYSISGSASLVDLLLNNPTDKPVTISSILSMHVLSTEGDIGELDIINSKCDGIIPPASPMKCKLVHKFKIMPVGLNIRVGAGVGKEPVFFKVGK